MQDWKELSHLLCPVVCYQVLLRHWAAAVISSIFQSFFPFSCLLWGCWGQNMCFSVCSNRKPGQISEQLIAKSKPLNFLQDAVFKQKILTVQCEKSRASIHLCTLQEANVHPNFPSNADKLGCFPFSDLSSETCYQNFPSYISTRAQEVITGSVVPIISTLFEDGVWNQARS